MEQRCALQPRSPRAPRRPPQHLGVSRPGLASPRPAVPSLLLQPQSQELSSPRQLNQPPSSRVSSPSFVCTRAELGRREKGEVALSVWLLPPLPGLLEVPPGRREPRGGCRSWRGASGPPGRGGPSRARGSADLSWGSTRGTISPLRPPLGLPRLPPTPRHPERSVQRRGEGRKPQINSGGSSASSGGAGSAGRVRRLVLSARPQDFAMGWGPRRLRAVARGQRRRRPHRG